MSLGIQRGLSSSLNPAASERRATELRGTDVAKATDEELQQWGGLPLSEASWKEVLRAIKESSKQ